MKGRNPSKIPPPHLSPILRLRPEKYPLALKPNEYIKRFSPPGTRPSSPLLLRPTQRFFEALHQL